MKYWGPINSPGGIHGNDGYVNGNPSVGAQGSIPTFQSFEQTLRGLQNLVAFSEMIPDGTLDDIQIAVAVRSQRLNWTTTYGGTANALTAAFDPIPLSLADIVGTPIRGLAAFQNTGPSTLTVYGLSERAIAMPDGTPLAGGEIKPGAIVTLIYDGVKFQLIGVSYAGGGGGGEPPPPTDWDRLCPGFFHAVTPVSPNAGWYTSLGAGVWTKINAPIEKADVDNWYNPAISRYQPSKPGYYFFCGDCYVGSNVNHASAAIRVVINGSPVFQAKQIDIGGAHFAGYGNGQHPVCAGVTWLNGTTDYAELYAYEDYADSSGLRQAGSPSFSGWFIGAGPAW